MPAAVLALVSPEAAAWFPDTRVQDISHSALTPLLKGSPLVSAAAEKSNWKSRRRCFGSLRGDTL